VRTREAPCSCGQLRLTAKGDPIFTGSDASDVVAAPVGAFADPSFPPPTVSVYESRRHPWLAVPDAIEHLD
jgi:hypothetical protein